MTWEQKWQAIESLGGTYIKMRAPGNWYCSGPEKGGNGMLRSMTGNGRTPEEAVNELWREIESLPYDRPMRLIDGRRVRWNGYMFRDNDK